MPKVEQYGNRVSTQLSGNPRAAAPVDDGLSDVGRGLAAVGQGFGQMKQRVDETAAEEALLRFEKEKNKLFFDPKEGFFNKQGRNAYDGAEPTSEALNKLREQYANELSSEQARNLFERAANRHIANANQDIMRHASKGLSAWEISTIEAEVENSLESASLYWNDEKSFAVSRERGRQAVMDSAERQGLSPEATAERLQTYESSYARAGVEAALMQSSADAERVMEQWGDRLEGPDKRKLEGMIARKKEAEHNAAVSAMAVNKATVLNDKYDSREEMLAEIDKIEDPDLRRKTMSETMYRFNQRKTAEKEAQAEAFEMAETFIQGGASAEQFQMQHPDAWQRLTAKQRRAIERGKGIVTDNVMLTNLLLKPKDELAKVNPVDYFDRLSPSDRTKLTNAVKTARGTGSDQDRIESQIGRSHTAQMKSAAERIFGDPKGWNEDEQAQVDAFYQLVTEEAEHRQAQKESRILSSQEFTDVINDMTRKWSVNRSLLVPGSTDYDLTDVPAEDVPAISRFLRENGVPVTSDNIVRAWQQARED